MFDCTDIFNFTSHNFKDEISCLYCFASRKYDDKNNSTYARFFIYNVTEELMRALTNRTVDMLVYPFTYVRGC